LLETAADSTSVCGGSDQAGAFSPRRGQALAKATLARPMERGSISQLRFGAPQKMKYRCVIVVTPILIWL
jgi:hypothetical protein